MRDNYTTAPDYRETVVAIILAVLFGAGIFLFLLMITGWLLLAVLATVGAMAAVGGLHYLVWGKSLEQSADRRHAEELWARAKERSTQP